MSDDWRNPDLRAVGLILVIAVAFFLASVALLTRGEWWW